LQPEHGFLALSLTTQIPQLIPQGANNEGSKVVSESIIQSLKTGRKGNPVSVVNQSGSVSGNHTRIPQKAASPFQKYKTVRINRRKPAFSPGGSLLINSMMQLFRAGVRM